MDCGVAWNFGARDGLFTSPGDANVPTDRSENRIDSSNRPAICRRNVISLVFYDNALQIDVQVVARNDCQSRSRQFSSSARIARRGIGVYGTRNVLSAKSLRGALYFTPGYCLYSRNAIPRLMQFGCFCNPRLYCSGCRDVVKVSVGINVATDIRIWKVAARENTVVRSYFKAIDRELIRHDIDQSFPNRCK